MSSPHNTEYKKIWKDEYLKWICGFANAQLSESGFATFKD